MSLARSLYRNDIGAKSVIALAAILNKTKITNLECAAAPECLLSCQRPLTPLTAPASAPMFAVCGGTNSVPKQEPLSPRASRATPRCNPSSRPPCARTSSRVFAFVSAPVDIPTFSPFHPAPRSQYRRQRHQNRHDVLPFDVLPFVVRRLVGSKKASASRGEGKGGARYLRRRVGINLFLLLFFLLLLCY